MRLTVFGASGGTGTHVVRRALAARHEVVAVVREPARLALPAQAGLEVFRADPMDAEEIFPAVDGADAVISALGPRGRGPTTVCSAGVRSELQAMGKAGVSRLVVISASGAYIDAGDGPVTSMVLKPLLQRVLRESLADVRRMEDEVRSSAVDWTIMRPPQLTNGSRRGRYRAAVDRNVGSRISRADLADAILSALGDPATAGHSIGVGY